MYIKQCSTNKIIIKVSELNFLMALQCMENLEENCIVWSEV